jgi:hypothetical protein
MKKIDLNALDGLMTYSEYRSQMQGIVDKGVDHDLGYSQVMVDYTVLNHQRMARWERKLKLENLKLIGPMNEGYTLLVITEGWCGDAAHINPVLNKVAGANPGLSLLFINRDWHLDIMDSFLTNGGRSIPKAVLLDGKGGVISTWGPRPSELQAMYLDKRKETPDYAELSIWLQKWYNKDKGQTTAMEVISWLEVNTVAAIPQD